MLLKCGGTGQRGRAEVRPCLDQSGGNAETEVDEQELFCAAKSLGLSQSLMLRARQDCACEAVGYIQGIRGKLAPRIYARSLPSHKATCEALRE
jgi:hypothetical protein